MPDLERTHLISVRRATPLGQLTEIDLRVQLIEGDGEDDRGHLAADDVAEHRRERLRAPDHEVVPLLEERGEKREALNVVPVNVRQENVTTDRRAVRARDERSSELTYPGAGVEHDEPARRRADLDARRVATVANCRWARTRNGAARPPKLNAEGHTRL
jgi:hypothetical protein